MLWIAALRGGGYGQFRLNGRMMQAHRVSYVLAYGQIPAGLVVDHVKTKGCTNRHCVAPEHLEAVTPRENTLRGETVPAANAAKTHCPADHPYDAENTYVRPGGERDCRACHRTSNQDYSERQCAVA